VFEGVFPRLMRDFDRWALQVDEVLRAGPAVVGLGRYRGRAGGTGARFTAEFAHVFRVRRGRIARVQQFTDTALIAGALGERGRSAAGRRRPVARARRGAASGA
jgi:ketosteroid isomerase-like protein